MLPDGSMNAYPVPRPLSKEEIQSTVQDYATAAHNAIEIAGAIPPQLLLQARQGDVIFSSCGRMELRVMLGLLTHA